MFVFIARSFFVSLFVVSFFFFFSPLSLFLSFFVGFSLLLVGFFIFSPFFFLSLFVSLFISLFLCLFLFVSLFFFVCLFVYLCMHLLVFFIVFFILFSFCCCCLFVSKCLCCCFFVPKIMFFCFFCRTKKDEKWKIMTNAEPCDYPSPQTSTCVPALLSRVCSLRFSVSPIRTSTKPSVEGRKSFHLSSMCPLTPLRSSWD